MSGHIGRFMTSGIATALSLAALAALPSTTFADDRGDRYDRGARYERDDRRDNSHHRRGGHHDFHRDSRSSTRIDIDIRTGSSWERVPPPPLYVEQRVWVEPVYRTVGDRVWVAPVYRTVVEKVWVEAVVQRRSDRVWVPDRYEVRETVCYERGRRVVRREHILVEPGHFEHRPCEVVLQPGYFKECPRQELVCEGHWETAHRQELVSPGHWETRRIAASPAPRYEEHSSARIDVSIPIRW